MKSMKSGKEGATPDEIRQQAATGSGHVFLETTSRGCCVGKEEHYMLNQSFAVVRHGHRLDHVPEEWKHHPDRPKHPNDTPLTEEGFSAAREVGKRLKAYSEEPGYPKFGVIVCSPYLRCAQTACCIAESLPLRIRFDLCLGEIFDATAMRGNVAGKRQHRSATELEAALKHDFPDAQFVRTEDNELVISNEKKLPDFPEPFDGARMRFCAKVHKLVRQAASELVSPIIVTHGDCVSAVLGMLYGDKQVKRVPMAGYALGNRNVKVMKKDANTVLKPADVYGQKWDLRLSDGIELVQASHEHLERRHSNMDQIRHSMIKSAGSAYELTPRSVEQRHTISFAARNIVDDEEVVGKLIKKAQNTEFLQDPDRISYAGPLNADGNLDTSRQNSASSQRTGGKSVGVVPGESAIAKDYTLAKRQNSVARAACEWLCRAFL